MKQKNNVNKWGVLVVVILAVGTLTFAVVSLLQSNSPTENSYEVVDSSDLLNTDTLLLNLAASQDNMALTLEEINGLVQMREEEKLAHDVYLTLYDKWQLPIFKNIAASELTHTNSVAVLLSSFQIEDPIKDDTRGLFTNPDFTDLYNNLIGQGNISVIEALKVGATVEDLDIYDLEILLAGTTNEAITNVYNNLVKGSRNHIRSFTQNLSKYNSSYSPSYISRDTYDQILSGSRETGVITK